jgi:hypothetical protein
VARRAEVVWAGIRCCPGSWAWPITAPERLAVEVSVRQALSTVRNLAQDAEDMADRLDRDDRVQPASRRRSVEVVRLIGMGGGSSPRMQFGTELRQTSWIFIPVACPAAKHSHHHVGADRLDAAVRQTSVASSGCCSTLGGRDLMSVVFHMVLMTFGGRGWSLASLARLRLSPGTADRLVPHRGDNDAYEDPRNRVQRLVPCPGRLSVVRRQFAFRQTPSPPLSRSPFRLAGRSRTPSAWSPVQGRS